MGVKWCNLTNGFFLTPLFSLIDLLPFSLRKEPSDYLTSYTTVVGDVDSGYFIYFGIR